jgi:hypothetical protein
MLSKREKRLLMILAWVCAGCVLLAVVFIRSAQMGESGKNIAEYEAELQRFELIQPNKEELTHYFKDLSKEIEREQVRFYKHGEMDLTQFGKKIHKLLADYNLAFSRFQRTDDKGSRFIEVSISGSAWNFSRFIKKIFESEKYWSMPYITLTKKGNSALSATFRINYEELEE